MGFYKPTVSISQFNALQSQVNTNTTNISSLQSQVNTNTTNISTLQSQVNTNTTNINTILNKALYLTFPVGTWKTHGLIPAVDATVIVTTANGATWTALDAFPFYVLESTVVCDKMAIIPYTTGTLYTNGAGTPKTVLGVYTDASGYPGTLIAQTSEIDVSTQGWKEATFIGGNITLNQGWYWLARMTGTDLRANGLFCSTAFVCGAGIVTNTSDPSVDSGSPGLPINGVRYTYASYPGPTLPSTFPSLASGAKWLSRQYYVSPLIHRIA